MAHNLDTGYRLAAGEIIGRSPHRREFLMGLRAIAFAK